MKKKKEECLLCDSSHFIHLSDANKISLMATNFSGDIAMWAAGDFHTPFYWPKYCPECGRKLSND